MMEGPQRPPRTWRAVAPRLPAAMVVAGVAWSAVALLDPARPSGTAGGPLLAVVGFGIARLLGRGPARWLAVGASLAAAYAIGTLSQPDLLRADSSGYYVYLRSAAFDHDLDFADEWAAWGHPEQPVTATGHRYNQYTVGPALLWSPFFVAAHLYVKADRLIVGPRYEADGYSAPYLRSAAVGTITASVAAGWLLALTLAGAAGGAAAALAVIAAVATSPVAFYVFVQPGMSHGPTFAVAAVAVWAVERARRAPSRGGWILAGALTGVLVLMRLQAAVFVLFPALVAAGQLFRKRVRPTWILAASAAGALAVVPQLVAWKILYGSFFRVPAGPGLRPWGPGLGWFDPGSPRLADTLLAADHGLFTWTPATLLGVAGLFLAFRRWAALAAGGLTVLLATAWVTGAMADWWGSDAFGARRFDLVVPFLAVGLAALLDACRSRPLAAPALVLAAMALWNVGVIRLFRDRVVVEAPALEEMAGRQARQLRRLVEDGLERVAGRRGRALAYKFFVGRFFYWNTNLDGTIDLARGDPRTLTGGWSEAQNREGPPTFRWALYPQACVRIPLDRPAIPLRTVVTARAPNRVERQIMTIALNGAVLKQAELGHEWEDVAFTLPLELLAPGENLLCLHFSDATPEADGARHAAAVSRIQLP
jgi:hypothetical protein